MRPIIALATVALAPLALAASACSEQTPDAPQTESAAPPPAPCVQRRRAWPQHPRDFIGSGIGGLVFYEVEVRPNGSLRFNHEEIALADLPRYLALTGQLQPNPYLVLRTTPASHCETAERVRAMMDAARMCRHGTCFESAAWEALGLPGFEENERRKPALERVGR